MSHLIFRFLEPKSKLSRVALLLVIPAFLSQPLSYTGRSLPAAVPLAFTAYIGALIFCTLAYRLSPFHPLAKYPGPVISKASKWWAAYICARGDPHRYYKDLHDRYGDVVRIGQCRNPLSVTYLSTYLFTGPNELSIRDASLIHPVLGQGGLPKGPRASMSSRLPLNGHNKCYGIRLGWSTRKPVINLSTRSSKTHASTQALESSVFIYGCEGVRGYRGKSY